MKNDIKLWNSWTIIERFFSSTPKITHINISKTIMFSSIEVNISVSLVMLWVIIN